VEERQYCYLVKGLVAPLDGISYENVLVKGIDPSDQAKIYFKVNFSSQEEKEKIENGLPNRLENIAQVHALVTDRYVSIHGGSSSTYINTERPFGWDELKGGLSLIPVYTKEDRKNNVTKVNTTLAKYHELKSVFEEKEKSYLRNAIDYYYRSLEDNRLEKKLIDLMISLESLFSREIDELNLWYSLRASFFLSSRDINRRVEIYNKIRSLYRKRSKVVHGTEDVNLDYSEIICFQEYVREAIKIFLYLKKSKDELLGLLDQSVVDNKKLEQFNEVVDEAINKW